MMNQKERKKDEQKKAVRYISIIQTSVLTVVFGLCQSFHLHGHSILFNEYFPFLSIVLTVGFTHNICFCDFFCVPHGLYLCKIYREIIVH